MLVFGAAASGGGGGGGQDWALKEFLLGILVYCKSISRLLRIAPCKIFWSAQNVALYFSTAGQ